MENLLAVIVSVMFSGLLTFLILCWEEVADWLTTLFIRLKDKQIIKEEMNELWERCKFIEKKRGIC